MKDFQDFLTESRVRMAGKGFSATNIETDDDAVTIDFDYTRSKPFTVSTDSGKKNSFNTLSEVGSWIRRSVSSEMYMEFDSFWQTNGRKLKSDILEQIGIDR